MKQFFLTTVCVAAALQYAQAQTPFLTKEYIDINKIKAATLVHGDMWWDPTLGEAQCEFPKGTGRNATHAGGLWMMGIDQGGFHVSNAEYRMQGVDYWPGPLSSQKSTTFDSSERWAKIWKVNATDIATLNNPGPHTITNIPKAILEWPAKNNPYAKGNNGVALAITTSMAPFVDVDKDGSYDPLKGDYPDMKGDQMLWWVFSDKGPTHYTQTLPLGVEVQAKAYAYNRGGVTDNMIFYEYDMTNKTASTYDSCTFGLWTGADLGFYADDYVGFDSAHRLGFVYNGKSIDGNGSTNAYGTAPPVMGITLLEGPGDNSTTQIPAGSFMYYNNDNTIMGNPQNMTDYVYYMHSTFKNGASLKNDFQAPGIKSNGSGAGPVSKYAFTGDPAKPNEWSECASNNTARDLSMILSAEDFKFQPNATVKFAFALLVTDTSSKNICPLNTTGIKTLADTALYIYYHPPQSPVSVPELAIYHNLKLYPNPANNILYVECDNNSKEETVLLYDITGRKIDVRTSRVQNKLQIDVSALTTGTYTIVYQNDRERKTSIFIKE